MTKSKVVIILKVNMQTFNLLPKTVKKRGVLRFGAKKKKRERPNRCRKMNSGDAKNFMGFQ